jgi:hypothetical protein
MALSVLAIVAAVVSAAATAYGTYAAQQAQAQQAKAAQRAAQMQADAEAAAAEARRRQKKAEAERFLRSQLSRAGAAGVQIGEGSLLEGQMEAASLAEYEANLAAYPHVLSSQRESYRSKIFGLEARRASSGALLNSAIAGFSSLAASYGSFSPLLPSSSSLNVPSMRGTPGEDF